MPEGSSSLVNEREAEMVLQVRRPWASFVVGCAPDVCWPAWGSPRCLAPGCTVRCCLAAQHITMSSDSSHVLNPSPSLTCPVHQVYRELRHRHPELGTKPSVAVISPYKAQVRCAERDFILGVGQLAAWG